MSDSESDAPTTTATRTLLPPPEYAKPIFMNGSKEGDNVLKLVKSMYEENKSKAFLRGVKFVNKAIRKGKKGFLILAADAYPLDVIAHLPVLAEENRTPYIFLERRSDIGRAMFTKRSIVAVYVLEPSDASKNKKLYDKVTKKITKKSVAKKEKKEKK